MDNLEWQNASETDLPFKNSSQHQTGFLKSNLQQDLQIHDNQLKNIRDLKQIVKTPWFQLLKSSVSFPNCNMTSNMVFFNEGRRSIVCEIEATISSEPFVIKQKNKLETQLIKRGEL